MSTTLRPMFRRFAINLSLCAGMSMFYFLAYTVTEVATS